MHGIISLTSADSEVVKESRGQRILGRLRRNRAFLLIVFVPTLLVAGYYYLIASDQYVSEAHFIVRTADTAPAAASGIGQIISIASGATGSQPESLSVADYLTSHDAVSALQAKGDLVARYRRPGVDIFSRLRTDTPTQEKLLDYYRAHTSVQFSSDTGITTVKARAFRAEDAFAIAKLLLRFGDMRVNSLNQQSYDDAIANSSRQLRGAETALQQAKAGISSFRANSGDIDPEGTGKAQISLVSQLNAQLSTARATLISMGGLISHSSPQYVALAQRVRGLESQVAVQSSRLAGNGGSTIASSVAGYNELQLRQEMAAKRYELATTAVERARDQVLRKQLYLVRVVQPNLPQKSLYPERFRIVATVFFAFLLTYGIGWLILAGVKEHSA